MPEPAKHALPPEGPGAARAPVSFKDHFSVAAASYAVHRPTYPAALAEFLAAQAPARDLAWDCGCGSGQLSTLLGDVFARVIATDASAEQIANAAPHAHVVYRRAAAETSGLPDLGADLVVAAQAAHWFDLPAFYAEVRRVARPGALVALVTYGIVLLGEPALDQVMGRFYWGALHPFWPPERRHVEDGYRSLAFPFPEVAAPPLAMRAEWTLAQLVGYLHTWSAVLAMERAGEAAAVAAFESRLAAAWGPAEMARTIRWPLAVRAGRG